jgi:uncharacterized ion transporter superfamily protein YfcC
VRSVVATQTRAPFDQATFVFGLRLKPLTAETSDEMNKGTPGVTASVNEAPKWSGQLHPVLIVVTIMLTAAVLTHFLPAGKYRRDGIQVIPGTYAVVDKMDGVPAILSPKAPEETDSPARAAGVVAVFTAIPAGMTKSANLFFMVMFVGGMFGILRATGAIDAGVDRLLHFSSGNVYLLTAGLMFLLSCGSTFLGLSSAYLALIPLVLGLGQRLGLPNLFAPIVVALADFIGYAASVTNPIALGVAQPLVGVPLFSGIAARLIVFILMFAVGLGYVVLYLRRQLKVDYISEEKRLTARQTGVVITLVLGGIALVVGTGLSSWRSPEMAAAFIALGVALALVGGIRPAHAADAWLDGMKGMLLPCLTIGLASAIGIVLQSSQVIDGIVQALSSRIHGHAPAALAGSLMAVEMAFGVIIPSVSSKAAISLPIMTPIAHLSGVSGQVTVSALLLGSGMTNMITPTNDLLLAFLAASKVDYVQWVRFIAPLFVVFCIISFVALYIMTALGA